MREEKGAKTEFMQIAEAEKRGTRKRRGDWRRLGKREHEAMREEKNG